MILSRRSGGAVLKTLDGREMPLAQLEGRRIIALTCHRRENHGQNMQQIFAAVKRIAAENPDVAVVYPVHPNPCVRKAAEALQGAENIILTEPLSYADMIELLAHCCFLVTDSGGLQEEAPALGKPAAIIRNETERFEAVESGAAVMAGVDEESVYSTLSRMLTDEVYYLSMASKKSLYGDGRACGRIISVLAEI